MQVPKTSGDREMISATPFGPLIDMDWGRNDASLGFALVERWWDTTHTFHFPWGEAGITPMDFTMLTGMGVGEGEILHFDVSLEILQMAEFYFPSDEVPSHMRLIGADFGSGGIRSSWFTDRYPKYLKEQPSDYAIDENTVNEHVRAFLFYYVGQYFFKSARSHIRLELTRLLLSWEWALSEKYDYEGGYPIHYAADYGYASIVEALLDTDKSAAYYVTKREKKTALHRAARHGHVKVMRELVSRCPCSAELVDARNCNVVHFVMKSQRRAAVFFVLKTPSLWKLVNEFNGVGNAPIHQLAISSGPPTTMNPFIKHPEVDAHKFNKSNSDALDLIAKFGKNNFMQSSEIKSQWQQLGLQRCRRIAEVDEEETFKEEDGDDSEKRKSNDVLNYIRKEREGYLVAAALIATVAFAADLKENEASPILLQNAAFKTFIVTNYVSQILSTVAVLLHLHTTFIEKHQAWMIVHCFRFQLGATFYAVFFMLTEFISGTYAIQAPSRMLNITLSVLAIVFFMFLYYLNINGLMTYAEMHPLDIQEGRYKLTPLSRSFRKSILVRMNGYFSF